MLRRGIPYLFAPTFSGPSHPTSAGEHCDTQYCLVVPRVAMLVKLEMFTWQHEIVVLRFSAVVGIVLGKDRFLNGTSSCTTSGLQRRGLTPGIYLICILRWTSNTNIGIDR